MTVDVFPCSDAVLHSAQTGPVCFTFKRGKKQLLFGNIRYYFGVECETLPSLLLLLMLLLLLLLLLLLHARPEFEVDGLPLNERAVREGEKEREREREKERERGSTPFSFKFCFEIVTSVPFLLSNLLQNSEKKYQKTKTVVWNLPKIVFDGQTRFLLGRFSVKFRCCPFGLLVSSWSSQ